MNLTKKQKKELRKIYEKKIGGEWVKWVKNQPLLSQMEFVDIMVGD